MKKQRRRRPPKKRITTRKSVHELAEVMRNNMTKAEAWFWKHLAVRQRSWKYQFEPQVVVCGYIPDFYCCNLKLAVEIDGRVHCRKDVKKRDRLRTQHLRSNGVTVVRFTNSQVFSNVYYLLRLLQQLVEVM